MEYHELSHVSAKQSSHKTLGEAYVVAVLYLLSLLRSENRYSYLLLTAIFPRCRSLELTRLIRAQLSVW